MTEEQWMGVAGAVGTAIAAVVAAVLRKNRNGRAEVARIQQGGRTEGRLWSRITELEDRIGSLEIEKAECRDQLSQANARIAILERQFASINPPPMESVSAQT